MSKRQEGELESSALEPGVPVRAVTRAFKVLESINLLGRPTIMEIAKDAQLPYPTAYRMVMTLLHDGWIEAERNRKRYRPTERVWSLVSGFQLQDLIVAIARDSIVRLTAKVHWPVTLSVRVGSYMMVKDSTHTLTSQTFANYYPGYTLPITDCAAGKAYLAFCEDSERKIYLEAMRKNPDPSVRWALQIFEDEDFFRAIRKQGFATHARQVHTHNPGKTSAIAVPVFADGKVQATLALIYFDNAMKVTEAVEQYSALLRECAQELSEGLDNHMRQLPND